MKMTQKTDFVVCITGANYVAKNETDKCVKALKNFLTENKPMDTVIVTFPHRHDLTNNSSVNKEIRKMKIKIKKLCSEYTNCCVLNISKLSHNLHTKYGLYLNYEGKSLCAIMSVK